MGRFFKVAALTAVLVAGATAAHAGGFANGSAYANGGWDVGTDGYGSGMGEIHTYSSSQNQKGREHFSTKLWKGTSQKYMFDRSSNGSARIVGNSGMSGSFGGVMTQGYASGSAWGSAESFSQAGSGY
ncbi:MAG: hypothetical protein V3V97_10605 [Hyphomicrobiaceae bacterium]